MITQFTVDRLKSLTRPQLWDLCRERGLKCYPASASCIQAILDSQQQIEKAEIKTCANCPLFRPFNDGTGRGLCCGSDQVARDHHPQTGDCQHLIEEAKDQEAETTTVQSGSVFFNSTGCVGTYEVWNGAEKCGAIKMLEDGQWSQSYALTTKYGTPYAAAAALVEAVQLRRCGSMDIQVLENWGDKFIVCNIQNGNHYVVQPNYPEPKERCECGDCHCRVLHRAILIRVQGLAQNNKQKQ